MPWMTDLFYDPQLDQDVRGAFADRPLHEICMPGTHDSGCYANYMLSLNILSRTQTMNVAAQLAGGGGVIGAGAPGGSKGRAGMRATV